MYCLASGFVFSEAGKTHPALLVSGIDEKDKKLSLAIADKPA